MSTIPPSLEQNSFGYYYNKDSDYWPEHLLVPIGCKTKYENANYWKEEFTTIEETEF